MPKKISFKKSDFIKVTRVDHESEDTEGQREALAPFGSVQS